MTSMFRQWTELRFRARSSIKRCLIEASPLSGLAQRILCRQTRQRYEAWRDHYANCTPVSSAQSMAMLRSRAGDRLMHFTQGTRPPRVLLIGAHYAQDMGGMVQGLQAVCDLVAFHRDDGSFGAYRTPDEAAHRDDITRRVLWYLEQARAEGRPFDLVLGQFWSGFWPEGFWTKARREYGVVVAGLCMDGRHTFEGATRGGLEFSTRRIGEEIDLMLTAGPEVVQWYRASGCPAWFFPMASHPSVFHPMPELPKLYDVAFVGANYGIRGRLISDLKRAGLTIVARGRGWPDGPIPLEETPALFAQSRIVLGIGGIGHCFTDLVCLKLRDFDAAMSGSMYLTTRNPDLDLIFNVGSEIAVYDSVEKCTELCQYYATHHEERERVAAGGLRRSMADHNWERRFGALLSLLAGKAAEPYLA